ncbi:MAG TPA: PAS domain-containing protein, partial [bacterium]
MRTAKKPPAGAGDSWLTAPLPCVLIDRRGRIHGANPAAAALLETDAAALAGRDLQELFAPVPPLAALLRSRRTHGFDDPIEGTLARP